jgi:hypothetical protein
MAKAKKPDPDKIVAALRAHKEQIVDAHAQYSALEAVVIGFMLAFQKRGMGAEFFKEVFDYAADIHIANADRNPGATQTTRSLQVVDDLREAVIPHRRPVK